MSRIEYAAYTGGEVALVAATPKVVLNVISAANAIVAPTEISVTFDGTSVTAEPALIELCRSDQTTAGASTSVTITQWCGPTRTVQATAAKDYSTPPTNLTALVGWEIHPQAGIVLQLPLDQEPDASNGDGLCLRINAPANVNCLAYFRFKEG